MRQNSVYILWAVLVAPDLSEYANDNILVMYIRST